MATHGQGRQAFSFRPIQRWNGRVLIDFFRRGEDEVDVHALLRTLERLGVTIVSLPCPYNFFFNIYFEEHEFSLICEVDDACLSALEADEEWLLYFTRRLRDADRQDPDAT